MAADGSIRIDTSIDGKGFQAGLKDLGGMAAKGLVALTAAAGAGAIAIGKMAVSAYADYEQLIGGVETLFKGSASAVEGYANNAYKTAGMSANDYMETVTGFSASLLQSLGGDTAAAAKSADMAITDMSDNANKMGTDMWRITDAYQGFAKQNYTMLDNLKLGYGGTKTEMQRLLADATKLTGIKYNINNLNDVYQAIHVIQGELGITGTTAKEASTTIQGSASAMKAAWENLLVGLADDTQDFDTLLDNLVDSVGIFAENIMPRVETALGGVTKLVEGLAPQIGAALPGLAAELLPRLMGIGLSFIESLLSGIQQSAGQLSLAATEILTTFAAGIISVLPQVVETGISLLLGLIQGLTQTLPSLIPVAIDAALSLADYLIDNIDLLVGAGIQLLLGLAQGIMDSLPTLIEKVPVIINNFADAVYRNLPKILAAGVQLIVILGKGIINSIPTIIANAGEIVKAIINVFTLVNLFSFGTKIITGLGNGIKSLGSWIKTRASDIMAAIKSPFASAGTALKDAGINLIKGLWNGISSAKQWIMSKISGFMGDIVGGVKSFFQIKSPSRLMANEIGRYLPPGITVGMDKAMPSALQDMKSQMAAMMEQARATVSAEQARIGATFNAQSTYQLAYAGSAAQTQDSAETPSFFIENHLIMNDRELAVAAGPAFAKELGWKGGKK